MQPWPRGSSAGALGGPLAGPWRWPGNADIPGESITKTPTAPKISEAPRRPPEAPEGPRRPPETPGGPRNPTQDPRGPRTPEAPTMGHYEAGGPGGPGGPRTLPRRSSTKPQKRSGKHHLRPDPDQSQAEKGGVGI